MKPNHTPTPWLQDGDNFIYALQPVEGRPGREENRMHLQVRFHSSVPPEERLATVALIKNAPEILECLRAAQPLVDDRLADTTSTIDNTDLPTESWKNLEKSFRLQADWTRKVLASVLDPDDTGAGAAAAPVSTQHEPEVVRLCRMIINEVLHGDDENLYFDLITRLMELHLEKFKEVELEAREEAEKLG